MREPEGDAAPKNSTHTMDLSTLDLKPDPDMPPDFDINYYLDMASDFEMTEEQKRELLLILWDIMKRFVELGFGLDSISLLDTKSPENTEFPSPLTDTIVQSKDHPYHE